MQVSKFIEVDETFEIKDIHSDNQVPHIKLLSYRRVF